MKNGGEFLLFSPLYISELLAYAINSLFTGGEKKSALFEKRCWQKNADIVIYHCSIRAVSSAGRAHAWRAWGHRFESCTAHQKKPWSFSGFKVFYCPEVPFTLYRTLYKLRTFVMKPSICIPPICELQPESIFFSLPIQSIGWRELQGSTCSNRTLQ